MPARWTRNRRLRLIARSGVEISVVGDYTGDDTSFKLDNFTPALPFLRWDEVAFVVDDGDAG